MSQSQQALYAKAVLFDVDGTLFDSRGAFYRMIKAIFREAGWVLPDKDYVVGLIGKTNDEIAASLVPKERQSPTKLKRWASRVERLWIREYLPKYVRLYPGVRKALGRLKRQGLKLGIVTNGSSREIPKYVEQGRVAQFMDVVVTADDVTHPKPHAEPLRLACRILRIDPSDCVYVGDTWMDAESARRAKTACVLVTWGIGKASELRIKKHCALVNSLDEFIGLLKPKVSKAKGP